MCSFGNGLRLGKGSQYGTYAETMHAAARTLAGRFNPKVGCLSSNWDRSKTARSFPVVIDIMMNLELLLWSAEHGGPTRLADCARSHADTTLRDFVRADGGTYHVVRYSDLDGKVIEKGTLQGAADESTWSRGQAWAQYGMVVMYRFTKERRYLDAAVRLADYFIGHLPADHVSAWDFQSPIEYRDVSATAIAAAGLLEMVDYLGDAERERHYRTQAEAMLSSLCQAPYLANRADTHCLLDHSVQYLPINSNVDVPAIFADYYFLEALVRHRRLCGAAVR
jgi:unsaturated chondroitin disaccharide hydrolase